MVKKICKILARTDVFFWSICWLIVMLVLGTLVQGSIGLYQAQTLYFENWIYWVWGIVPLPGTMLTLAVISVSLTARVFMDDWVWAKAGTILVHFSALVLLVGGFITATTTQEGAIVLREKSTNILGPQEDGTSDFVQHYFDLELAIVRDDQDIAVFGDGFLHDENILQSDQLPFDITVKKRALNAQPVMNGEAVDMQEMPRLPEEEENLSAVRIVIDGREIVLFEGIPMNKDVAFNDLDYQVFLRPARTILPFMITLNDFVKDVHPGTDDARSYHSDITVNDGDLEWETRIAMNEPLRYQGWTFYQASFLRDNNGEVSVLAAVYNKGRLFPYISSILLAFGLLVHLFQRVPKLLVLALLCTGFAGPVAAQETKPQRLDMATFAQLPVLHDGRVKPVDSFARHYLQSFSGRENFGDYEAVDWFAAVIFAPNLARDFQLFRVQSPDALRMIQLAHYKDRKFFSFKELRGAMRRHQLMIEELEKIPYEEMDPAQQYLMDLQYKLLTYIDLSHSMVVQTPDQRRSFPAQLFKVVPPQWGNDGGHWSSPWDVTSSGGGSPDAMGLMEKWGALGKAYLAQNSEAWDLAGATLRGTMESYANTDRLEVEYAYNNWGLQKVSFGFYLVAGLALLGGLLAGRADIARRVGAGLLAGGLVFHAVTLGMRMYVLARPPVSTLHESVIFVGLIAVLLALVLEWRSKNGLGVLIGSVCGVVLHQVAMSYAAGGDSLQVLVPVLNTNFWLATHVVTITIGYGACLVTGLMAHADLVMRALGSTGLKLLKRTMAMGLIALLFSIIGTILGGIWADQSWGRFWGWDPKENGALLICLWLIAALHGRIGGVLNPVAFMAAMAALPVVVSLAWFGVNLLNVGLHSYGFTEGITRNLFIFIGIEMAFIGAVVALIYRRKKGVS